MKRKLSLCLALAAVVVLIVIVNRAPRTAPSPLADEASAEPAPAVVAEPGAAGARQPPSAVDAAPLAIDFGAHALQEQQRPDFAKVAAFNDWAQQWAKAGAADRSRLQAEGLRLVRARRPEMKALIVNDPQRALEQAVPRVVRQELPAEIVAELEQPVSATGEYKVYRGRPAPGAAIPAQGLTMRYFETPAGASYKARVFGAMQAANSRKELPLRGVAIDRELAVAESPLRPLEVGERVPAGVQVDATCPVSGETTAAATPETPISDETPAVEVAGRVILLCNGTHVRVLDERYRQAAGQVEASGPGGAGFFFDNYPGTSSEAIGNFRCLYIRITYPDQLRAPNTEDSANTDMRNVAQFYLTNSFGKLTTTSVVTPLVVLPHSQAWYIAKDSEVDGLGLVHSDARAEARKLGYDSRQFNCTIVRVNGGPRLSGISWGGGDSVWVSWDGMDVLNHECGHSIGRNHANYWNTTDGTPYGTGSNAEYGNSFDVMGGGGGFGAHYNTISKRALGWLPDNYNHAPKTNGTYRVFAYDQPTLEDGRRYSVRVAKDSVRTYFLEYHPAIGGSWPDQALVMYQWSGMSNAGHLLDTTQGSNGGKGDGGIQLGRTYSDPESDQHFTLVSKNATTPVSIDVNYQRGPFPGNQAPTLSLGASATSIAVNGTITFTATANDPDGDPIAYHWEFSDGVTGTNAPVFARTFVSTAQITAMVTASDMKGATARRHVVVNVGSHGRHTITGQVLADGLPLAGVRVGGTSSRFCFTDNDGNYALSNNPTGAQALTALKAGYTFTPAFTNPITVIAGANVANWTAGAGVFVTVTKTADATEGGANGTFTLTRSGDASADLVVRMAPVGGTAALTTDFTLNPNYVDDGSFRTFTIPAGQASLAIAIQSVNDTAQEGPETVTLQVVANTGYLPAAQSLAVLTINDNDTTLPQVTVVSNDPYAAEIGADSGTFTFTRSVVTASPLTLSLAFSGTSTNGSDYASLSSSVVIPANQPSVTVTVSPTNDSAIETPEDCIVTINSNAAYVRAATTSATVTINDDDSAVVTVTALDADAAEAGRDQGVFLITRTGSTAAPLKVYYGLQGSALHGADYIALPGEMTIPPGAVSVPIIMTPYDDDLGEPETQSVILGLTTFNSAYSVGTASSATINITDNDDVPVVWVRAGSTVASEPSTNGSFTIRATGSATGNITVNYTVTGTASAGSDYTALSGSVTISANGSNEVTVNVPVLNDALVEDTETVVLTITPSAAYRVYNDPSATVRMRDDETAERVMVSTWNSAPNEGGTSGQFYFSRAGTTGDLAVNYAISGTAANGSDYAALSGAVTIPDTASGVDVTITPTNDALAEGTETITLTVLPGAGYGVEIPGSATLYLADNDALPITVGFQAASQVMTEQPGALGEYRDIAVALSAASANAVTVEYTSNGGTASGDDIDWAFVNASDGNAIIPGGTLTFLPGTTAQTIRIKVKNDGVVEGQETATLQLQNARFAALGTNQHTVLILDEPSLTVVEERWAGNTVFASQTWSSNTPNYTGVLASFTTPQDVADNYSRRLTGQIIAPTTGSYRFWIASDDASRLYLSTTSSAANKVQIASLASFSSFQEWDKNASQQSALITLQAGQSYYMEAQQAEGGGGDHVSVAWEGPGFTRTPVPTFVTTETNVTRRVRFLISASTRSETEGTEPMLMAVLDRAAANTPVSVSYTVGGTATTGSDFQLTPGTITFAPGETVKLLPLTILTDAVQESPETVIVTLTNPVNAQIVTPAAHIVTIRESTIPAINIEAVTPLVAEEAGPAEFSVTRSGAGTALAVTVFYTLGGTTSAGNDYTAPSGSVTIPIGSTSANFTIDLIDDTAEESDETIVATITANAAYDLGNTPQATATILDDDAPPTVTINSPVRTDVAIPAGVGLMLRAQGSRLTPQGPTSLPATWSKVSGPGNVTFEAQDATFTAATFSASGSYVLRASSTYGALTGDSDLFVLVGTALTAATIGTTTAAPSWSEADTLPGSGAGGTLTISSASTGISSSGTTDGFYFLAMPVTGDFDVRCRIVSMDNPGATNSCRAGIMVRSTTATNSVYAMTMHRSDGNHLFQARLTTGTDPYDSAVADSLPLWVRLVRSGTNFSAYFGTNGVAWTQQGLTQSIATMGTSPLVGLAVTSAVTATASTVVFDSLSFPLPTNRGPLVDAGIALSGSGPWNINATVTDDGRPAPATITPLWSTVTGAGTANFASASSIDTGVTFTASGSYRLRLTASDGGITTFDETTASVTVNTPLQAWRLANFGTTANTGTAADSYDFDFDTLGNLIEYALGSDPKQPNASPLAVTPGAGEWVFNFTRNPARTDVTLTLQGSTTIGGWTPLARSQGGGAFSSLEPEAAVSESGTSPISVTITVGIEPPQQFFNLKAETTSP